MSNDLSGEANPDGQIASSMVKQSLADLKTRLHQMRQEKQQIEQELTQFENRKRI